MTRHYALRTLATVIVLAVSLPANGQGLHPDTAPPAIRLRPDTLALFFNDVAGLRVRVVSAVVDGIASPRVFTLKNERGARYPRRPNEVAIFVDGGNAVVRTGAPVVVIGIARTLLGAELNAERPLSGLTDSERSVIDKLPLVMASAVDTPDGVHLIRPTP
jgi:hypothetical protein